ncbi:MAG: ATP synthase subunit b [Candidatus Roizmanbacteria bacterium GW2011_GWA2_32_13]|uniref:ATP synthase subunit b n=1 Tax=Candidatus Roizmanbacteria bacterium GW2011_GWA2_32_13 TaxID=1618475 RepID=A0A0F9ZCI9_9BACT|nr:MAG: ATP synthase subunit b [Candidatus Roizmanbacteria bacterium GW2011_GWA2_32_13]
MEELIIKLGIDWKLLIAQIINFGLLIFLLYKFTYGPIIKFLEVRSKKIAEGILNAEEMEKRKQEIEKIGKEIAQKAQEKANELLKKSKELAEKEHTKVILEAQDKVKKVIAEAKANIVNEKELAIAEAKTELGGLVLIAIKKVLGKNIDAGIDKDIIEESIKELK